MIFNLKNLTKKLKDEIINYLKSCKNYNGIISIKVDNENNLIINKEEENEKV